MPDFEEILKKAEQVLNSSYRDFKSPISGLHRDFAELKLQSAIFQYDISTEMIGVIRNKPIDFAQAVALKGLILRLFEYKLRLQEMTPKIEKLMAERGVPISREIKKELRIQFAAPLGLLERWGPLRNNAAGHYGADFNLQISSLESVDYDRVMSVAQGFLSYNRAWVKILRDAAWADFTNDYDCE
ncbi:hypothetical protein IGS59_04085 [Janthinobacterium sp. GW460P]|uniref:hypothetical protein n=1 Tax=unclassified Janthinobacterium TaxID=2610881 RepID=UPI00111C80CD|nr:MULTISPECIES: hypothetical protein [unclassified Janthinobacterium]MCC7701407.1 hypothetical protein [Janthinobacterium sp. GW460P]MCC7706914.1 hypothetical protein [Janthinobacterium sp. GW460W]